MRTTCQTFLRSAFAALFLLIARTVQADTVTWTGSGGDNLWHTDANWSSGTVPAPGDDVILNVPGNPVITITPPGVSVRSVQCSESLRLEDGMLALTDGVSSFTGPLNLSGGWISIDGASTVASASGPTTLSGSSCYAYNGAKLWLTNLTTMALTNGSISIWAQNADAAIYLSNVTNLVSDLGYTLYVHAYEGGVVDLHRLRNPNGPVSAYSRSTGSVVDLSGLSGRLAGPEGRTHDFSVDGGVILMPLVRALSHVSVSVTGDGQVAFGSLTNAEASSFYAYTGGKFWLTNLTTLVLTNGDITVWAQNADAAIYLPNVTNLVSNPGYRLYVYAFDGGLVDLHQLHNPDGPLSVTSRSAGSLVDLSGFRGRLAAPLGFSHDFNADGGAILMPLVRALSRVSVSVTGEGHVGLGSITNAEEGAFYAYDGGKLWLTNLTTLVLTNAGMTVWAQNADAAVYLSNVTNIVSSLGYTLYVSAFDGGLVDLRRLGNPNAPLYVHSRSAGSVVDLSSLSGMLAAPVGFAHILTAEDGAILMPQVRSLNRVSVNVTGNGSVGFGSITNAEESSFYAYHGARLWLTNLTLLVLTNGSMTLWAQGIEAAIYLSNVTNLISRFGHQLYVYAYDGGLVDLRRLRNPDGPLYVASSSAGSVVNLSSLSGTLSPPPNARHSLNALNGSILIPNVTSLERVDAFLTGEAGPMATQWRSLVNSTLTVENTTNDLSQLTRLVDSSVTAYTGAKVWLTNITTLYVTNAPVTVSAAGADAAVYLSNVTNAVFSESGYTLSLSANGGGEVDLRRLRNPEGSISIASSSAGSVMNLSAFSGTLSGVFFGSLSMVADYGGAILMPGVTALDQVDLRIAGEVQLPIATWHTITRSRLELIQVTNDLGRLTNILGTSFHASSGSKLWLTNLTTLFVTDSPVSLQAVNGAALYLPKVTNIVISPFTS
jgi:hypothetical protein